MATKAQIKSFIETLAPIIKKEAKARGYKYPSAIIAQACLESGYGTTSLASVYNYFGMKCGASWKGKAVTKETMEEYIEGRSVKITDCFRAYSSMEEGIKGYFDFISYSRYSNLKEAISSRNYLEFIKSDGYATASKYVENVYKIVEAQGLLAYDQEEVKTNDMLADEVIKGLWGYGQERYNLLTAAGYDYNSIQAIVNAKLQPEKIHVVVSGDTLFAIAKNYLGNGMRYGEIMALNGLTSETIYPGMKLKIPS